MPHVSRNKLTAKVETELLKQITVVLFRIQKREETEQFLSALLTPTEKLMLAKRLATIVLLEEGMTDTQIASSLNLTRIIVAKTRYYYESRGVGFRVALEKLKDEEDYEAFKTMLLSLARYSAKAIGGRI